jgi:hypothetical protein
MAAEARNFSHFPNSRHVWLSNQPSVQFLAEALIQTMKPRGVRIVMVLQLAPSLRIVAQKKKKKKKKKKKRKEEGKDKEKGREKRRRKRRKEGEEERI